MKTLKIIGIVIGTLISFAVIGFGGYGVYRVYHFGDILHEQVVAMAKANQAYITHIHMSALVGPVTAGQRSELAQLGEQLIVEIETISATIDYTIGEGKTMDEDVKSKKIDNDMKLLDALGTIAQDRKLTKLEYETWKDFYRAREKEESWQKRAFDKLFERKEPKEPKGDTRQPVEKK